MDIYMELEKAVDNLNMYRVNIISQAVQRLACADVLINPEKLDKIICDMWDAIGNLDTREDIDMAVSHLDTLSTAIQRLVASVGMIRARDYKLNTTQEKQ